MTPTKLLLTGAGGFVGSRIAHRVALGEDDIELTALIHSPSGPAAMRLARLPIEIEVGSITDGDLMTELMSECDSVINCAFSMGNTSVEGTKTLLNAAEQTGIESFVHMSTAVVHGHGHDGEITETAPFDPDGEYGELKLREEEIIDEFPGAPAPSIIRPMIVFGPGSDWVTGAVDSIRNGAVLADGGTGTLNQIYIDNLVDVILLALKSPAADGEAFLAVDDSTVSWQRYYNDIAELLGDHPPIETMSRREIEVKKAGRLLKNSVVPPARIPVAIVTSAAVKNTAASELGQTPWAEPLVQQLPTTLRENVLAALTGDDRGSSFEQLSPENGSSETGSSPETYELPDTRYIDMQTHTGNFSNQKIKDVLDWEQRVDYEEAIDLIATWLEYENVI